MEPFSILLNNILLVVAIVLFMNDSIILFVRGKNNRARRMLGTTTLIWGLMYGFFLYCSLKGLITYPIFCGEAFISSHFFICVMFFFPLEVLSPGWLNLKRLIIMLTPMTLLAIGYVVGLKLTGQRIEQFYTFTDFFNAMGRFNVWYRWILLICNCIFLFGLMKMLQKRELKYLKWQNDNFSDLDSVDISWLHYYWRMMMIIIVCYLVVAVWGSVWSIIAHTVIVIVCFSIMAYKGVFYEHSYPQYIVNEGFTPPPFLRAQFGARRRKHSLG